MTSKKARTAWSIFFAIAMTMNMTPQGAFAEAASALTAQTESAQAVTSQSTDNAASATETTSQADSTETASTAGTTADVTTETTAVADDSAATEEETSSDQAVTADVSASSTAASTSAVSSAATQPTVVSAQSDAPTVTPQTDGETYTPGTGTITAVTVVKQGSTETTGNIGVEAGTTPGQTLTSTVTIGAATKSATSVWIAFKLTVPKTLPSGGAVTITSGSIMDMDNGTTTATATDDGNGNWVLTGRTLASKSDGVVPGSFTSDFNIGVSKAAAGETLNVTEKAWLYSDGDANAVSTTRTLEYTTTPKYDTQSATFSNTSSNTSGWYNATTHVFQTSRPSDTTGWTYGRVWAVTSAVVDKGNERLDPTKPITWNITTKVQTVTNGVTTVDTTEANQPILLGIKSADPAVTTSQLGPVSDMTLGGVITPTDFYNYQTLPYKGDNSPNAYSFTQSGQTVTPSVTLSSSKSSTYDAAEVYAEYFVPAVSDGTGVTRQFVVTHDSLTATSYSGTTVHDSDATDNSYYYVVPPKADEDVSGIFSRAITFEKAGSGNYISKTNNGDTVDIRNNIRFQFDTSTIPDYSINAINMLVKIPSGIEATSDSVRASTAYKDSSGNVIKPTTLYAVKSDGSGWTGEYEMNHTQDYQLRYYDSLDAAKAAGTVVGILYEWRGGTWTSSYNLLETVKYFKVNSDSGVFLPTVQDVRVWRGDTTLTTADTWSGTNGAAVSEDTWGTDTKAHKDLMVPYDDGENTTGVYEKDTWDDATGAPKQNEGHTWGDTVYVMGGAITNNKTTTKQLNGTDIRSVGTAWNESWPTATYDIGSNQRTVDRALGFTVSGAGTTSLSLKADLDIESSAYYEGNTSKVARTGAAYLSTPDNPVTYTPNTNPALGGTFSGGAVIDPSNFTVPGDGEYQIYYTDTIGDATNLANDAVSGTTYLNFSNVDPIGDSTKLLNDKDTPVCFNTYVTKTSVSGLTKKASSASTSNNPSWDNTVDTTTAAMPNLYVLDVLPYDGDANGTKLNGTYVVSGLTTATSAATGTSSSSAFAVYYTTDTAVRTSYDAAKFNPSTTAPSTLGSTFTANGVTWIKATDNGSGSWSVPTGTTAVMACSDNLAAAERFNLHVALTLTGAHMGDTLANSSSYCYSPLTTAVVTPPAATTVASRSIAGTAWVDNDKDGVYDASKGDTLLSGVTVSLYKADGTQITKDANGTDYSVTTATDGSYKFSNVPENANGYYVAFSGTVLDSYTNTTKSTSAPDASATDSDVSAKDNGAYKTDVFTTKTDAQLVAAGLTSADVTGVGAGFVPSVFTVTYDYGTAPAGASALPASATHTAGTSVTVAAAATAPGYTFSGWADSAATAPVAISNGSFTMPSRDVTLTGTWTPKTYTVKYDTDGGTPATIADKTGVKWSDASLLPAEPTKAGYTFAGWQVSEGGTAGTAATATSKYSDLATNDSTASITLKATWTQLGDVTISYVSADTSKGTVAPASESLAPATGVAAGSTATAKVGYQFVNWTNAAGDVVSTDAHYTPAKVNNLNVAATYTAHFNAAEYTVSFDTDGGTPATIDSIKVAYGTVITADSDWATSGGTAPTKAGSTFAGWQVVSAGSGLTVGSTLSASDVMPASDVALKAIWKEGLNPGLSGDLGAVDFSYRTGASSPVITDEIARDLSGVIGTDNGVPVAATDIAVDAAQLAAINAARAAGKVGVYPLTFTNTKNNGTAPVNVTLYGDPDVTTVKSVSAGTAKPGDTVTYTIVATNNAEAEAVGFWVKDYVPANTTLVSTDGTAGTTTSGRQFASWFFDTIEPGESKTMTLTVKVAECQDGTGVDNVALTQATGTTTPPADVASADPSGAPSNKVSFTVSNPKSTAQGSATGSAGKSGSTTPKTGDTLPTTSGVLALAGLTALAAAWLRKRRSEDR